MSARVIMVTGMTCSHCVRAVTEEISQLAGVSRVQVDLSTGAVTVTADPMPAQDDLRAAITEAGYEVSA